jgi:hypothetical protein
MNPTETDSGVGSDEWMRERGFRPMTPEESKKHARFFTPCHEQSTGGGKIIDLVRWLHEALSRHKRGS